MPREYFQDLGLVAGDVLLRAMIPHISAQFGTRKKTDKSGGLKPQEEGPLLDVNHLVLDLMHRDGFLQVSPRKIEVMGLSAR